MVGIGPRPVHDGVAPVGCGAVVSGKSVGTDLQAHEVVVGDIVAGRVPGVHVYFVSVSYDVAVGAYGFLAGDIAAVHRA